MLIGVMLDMGYGHSVSEPVAAVVRNAAAQLSAAGAAGAVVTEMPPVFTYDPYPALDRLFQVRARTEWESIPEARRFEVLPAVAEWAYGAANYSAADFSRDADSVMRSQEFVRAKTSEFDFVISPVIPTVGFGAEEVGLDPLQRWRTAASPRGSTRPHNPPRHCASASAPRSEPTRACPSAYRSSGHASRIRPSCA